MIKINTKKWDSIPKDYKGIFQDYQGNNPDLKGRKCVMLGCIKKGGGSCLVFEGIDFIIEK